MARKKRRKMRGVWTAVRGPVRLPSSRKNQVLGLPNTVREFPRVVEDSEAYASKAARRHLSNLTYPRATLLFKQVEIVSRNLIGSYAFRVEDQYRRIDWKLEEMDETRSRRRGHHISWWLAAPSLQEIMQLEQKGHCRFWSSVEEACTSLIILALASTMTTARFWFYEDRAQSIPVELDNA